MMLAVVTSSLHTSYCHFFRPITPHRTFPVWTPILMSTCTPVVALTLLIAEIMERPILTTFTAWFGLETGRPDTQ